MSNEIITTSHPKPHLIAGHRVVMFWKTDTMGFVQWRDGRADIYDTKLLDPGETEEAACRTCERDLDIAELVGLS